MRAIRPPTPEVTAASGVRGRVRHTRGTVVVIALALALVASGSPLAASGATPLPEPPIPTAMAAAGDSISIATNHSLTCTIFGGCASRSWATGSNTSVDSHFLRLRDYNSRLTMRNAAFSGATMASLQGQFDRILLNNYRPGYVTVLIGANDICGTNLTPVETFRTQFTTAMNTLTSRSSGTSVFVASIPNLEQLYQLLKSNRSAQSAWAQYKVCPRVLGPNIVDRAPMVAHQAALNGVLQSVCASFPPTATSKGCRFDGGAVSGTPFLTTDVSTVDYFHPSAAGQKKLSQAAWTASFWPTR